MFLFSRRIFLAVAVCSCFLSAAPQAAIALDEAEARELVMGVAGDVIALVQSDVPIESKRSELKRLMSATADMTAIGRFAIGRPWNEMSDTQKDAYLSAFTDYVAKIYTSRFSDYKGETLEFAGSRSGKKDLYVLTNFARSGQQPLEVSWRVREIGGAPKILDIEAEGISLLVSLKNEMSGLLSQNNNSVDKVIEVLKTKA